MTTQEYANVFKALSDPIRFEIVTMLKKHASLCACDILEKFNITQPTLSYHMKTLVECNLVNYKKEGTWNYYTINLEVLKCIKAYL